MKKSRILPSAAGIIALTATIGFIDGERENENERYSRDQITLTTTHEHNSTDNNPPDNLLLLKEERPVYRVELRKDGNAKVVLVDANTGKVIPS